MRELCPLCHERVEWAVDDPNRRATHHRVAFNLDGKGLKWSAIRCCPDKLSLMRAWYCEETGQLAEAWAYGNRAKGEYRGPTGEVKPR